MDELFCHFSLLSTYLDISHCYITFIHSLKRSISLMYDDFPITIYTSIRFEQRYEKRSS
jgi:hypothetical protein